MTLTLDPADEAMLGGEHGPGVAMAMRIVARVAESMGAEGLIDIVGAHIDSCLYHGESGLDFARRLAGDGARVKVPTTLNVSSLDLLHPDLFRGDPTEAALSRAMMAHYEEMGCRPTWTCAPYQLDQRPGFGQHVAWAESNAIVFANSVLGARTHRYGDFIDICAAITGRAPAAGLHLDQNRWGEIVFRLDALPARLLDSDVLAPVLGYLIGQRAGTAIPVLTGLPADLPEHRLKALGAAAAASGSLGMFHAVGITPEAPSLDVALGGRPAQSIVEVSGAELRTARDELTTAAGGERLAAVSLGTPHYSVTEFEALLGALDGREVHADVAAYVNTGRDIWHEISLRGWGADLEAAGFTVVTDTCTYITPVMDEVRGVAMTDSAKWAHYAPGNLGIDVVFGALEDCVESAVAGHVVRHESIWGEP